MERYNELSLAEKYQLARTEVHRLYMMQEALRPHQTEAAGAVLLEIERIQTFLPYLEEYCADLEKRLIEQVGCRGTWRLIQRLRRRGIYPQLAELERFHREG